ncbi:winged helix DNA-binding domain-containing protein [Conexibacter sp. SYSU D00693]|uniref:winged helix DNA-binding domain-containing protein n=1 Tax=Conexibacter sp. SYSU D00693 TaxID=2812560 RepID=UPI00196B390B|nr:winged helix DNA-binding domain-containing protein [Conexibacter sp. SYSU D00693]
MARGDLGLVRRRLVAQRLTGIASATPAEAAGWALAIQGQEAAEVRWSIAQRTRGATDASVGAALDRGELVRTHVLRPTWHVVAPEDLRWLLRLTGPRVQRTNAPYYRQAGLDDALLARLHDVLRAELEGGRARTKQELMPALAEGGMADDPWVAGCALMHAELEALICNGPRARTRHTYALCDERGVPPAPERDREDDVAELCVRFLRSHGPSTAKDLGWWSSLTLADLQAGLGRAGEAVVEQDGGLWSAADPPPRRRRGAPRALLLGTFDELVVAHQGVRYVWRGEPGEALSMRPVLVDGETVGSWRRTTGKRALAVEVVLRAPLDDDEHAAVAAEAERLGAFHGLPVTLEVRAAAP